MSPIRVPKPNCIEMIRKAMLTFISRLPLRNLNSHSFRITLLMSKRDTLCLLLDLRIRRQHSSESVSSINSATSHSSIGSGHDADSKKKKKKNWVSHPPSCDSEAHSCTVSQAFPCGALEVCGSLQRVSFEWQHLTRCAPRPSPRVWCWRACFRVGPKLGCEFLIGHLGLESWADYFTFCRT